jgi:hypothetical protein
MIIRPIWWWPFSTFGQWMLLLWRAFCTCNKESCAIRFPILNRRSKELVEWQKNLEKSNGYALREINWKGAPTCGCLLSLVVIKPRWPLIAVVVWWHRSMIRWRRRELQTVPISCSVCHTINHCHWIVVIGGGGCRSTLPKTLYKLN